MKRVVGWVRGAIKKDPLNSKPVLKDHLVTYLSFSDVNTAYISDVVLRETFIKIDRWEHDALKLSNGHKTIGEIASLIFAKYPKKYSGLALAQKETYGLFQKLLDKGIIELMDHG